MIRPFAILRSASARALVLALAMLVLGACQTASTTAPAPAEPMPARGQRLQTILESGVLRVGLSANQPPLNMRNKQGEIMGFEVDLVRALGNSMGLEVSFVPMPFAELIPTLERGQLDLVISGMTITPERNARVAFAGPYFISGKSVLTKSEVIANTRNPGDLDDPSRRFAALAGSTSAAFVRDVFPSATLVATADYDEAVRLVIDDQVDALVADYQICALSVWRNPNAELFIAMEPYTVEPLGIALPADAPLLVNLVENYLDTLEYTGLLSQFKARWLGDGSWVDELP